MEARGHGGVRTPAFTADAARIGSQCQGEVGEQRRLRAACVSTVRLASRSAASADVRLSACFAHGACEQVGRLTTFDTETGKETIRSKSSLDWMRHQCVLRAAESPP